MADDARLICASDALADSGRAQRFEVEYFGERAAGGVALIVEALTDNRNRTATNVRTAFAKNNGNLGAAHDLYAGEGATSVQELQAELAKARAAFVEEVARLRDQGVTDDEVAVAGKALREQEDNALADDGSLVRMLRRDRYLGRDLGWHQARRAAIAKVTAADVTRVIKQHLVPEELTWVEAGDLAKAK